MPNTWILVADDAGARVYESRGSGTELRLVRDLPPRETAPRDASRAFVIEVPVAPAPRDPAPARFARELAWLLGRARSEQCFQRLVLVAPTEMLGSIRKELDPPTRALVSHTAADLKDVAGI